MIRSISAANHALLTCSLAIVVTSTCVTVLAKPSSAAPTDLQKAPVEKGELPLDEVPSLERLIPPPKSQRSEQNQIAKEQADQAMRLAWDQWHHRVAEEIYIKWIFPACRTTCISEKLVLTCVVTYKVTKDRRVTNIRIIEPSQNPAFDSIVVRSVESMNGSEVLKFPEGSMRESVDKISKFGWGFRPKIFACPP